VTAPFALGTLVASRYRIERALAKGGMGAVYVAKDERMTERVALKIAAASGAAYDEFKARFAREAKLGSRLGKVPGFVRAFEWGDLGDGTNLYLVMGSAIAPAAHADTLAFRCAVVGP
jgi:serine/threonine-protein kinase